MPLGRSAALFVFLALLVAAPCAVAKQAGMEPLRAEFKAAMERFKANESDQRDSSALRAYTLYPYLEAARLRRDLAQAVGSARDPKVEARVQAYLQNHAQDTAVRELRADWWRNLIAREAWADVLAEIPAIVADPEFRCAALTARIKTGAVQGLKETLTTLWTEPKPLHDACVPAVDWYRAQEALTFDVVQQRALALYRNGQPLRAGRADRDFFTGLYPDEQQAWLDWARQLSESPQQGLQRLTQPVMRDGVPYVCGGSGCVNLAQFPHDLLLDAFDRLARRNPNAATALYSSSALRVFEEPELNSLHRSLALGYAYDRRREALDWFAQVPETAADALVQEWRVRAAIYHGDWRRALDWLERMPPAGHREPRWRYWRARALEQLGRKDEAAAQYAQVAQEREYYGFLAAEKLGRAPELQHTALPEDDAAQKKLLALSPLVRARELFYCEMPDEAAVEWRLALAGQDVAAKREAGRLAASWGWHEQAITVLSGITAWDDLLIRYPLPYDSEVDAAAKEAGLPANWVYGVLRTESLYNPKAVSTADALGLLQIRLATARQLARKTERPLPAREDMFRPEVNIPLGAAYLRQLVDRYGGNLPLALAAYNAGYRNAERWLPARSLPADIWLENIPYNETRGHVQRTLANIVIYGWRREGKPAPLLPLLPAIGPAGENVAS